MINQLPRGVPTHDENGKMLELFYQWMLSVTNLQPIVGTGSPEGVVTAGQTRLYMDQTGAAGSVLYIKRDSDIGGDRSKGWKLV